MQVGPQRRAVRARLHRVSASARELQQSRRTFDVDRGVPERHDHVLPVDEVRKGVALLNVCGGGCALTNRLVKACQARGQLVEPGPKRGIVEEVASRLNQALDR